MKRTTDLSALPHADTVQALLDSVEPGGIAGAIVGRNSRRRWRVLVWGPACTFRTEAEAAAHLGARVREAWAWRPAEAEVPPQRRGPPPGRAARALESWRAGAAPTLNAAARAEGVSAAAVYRALRWADRRAASG